MIKLNSKISTVPGIGPKYTKLLQKLDINSVEDLIYHFPFRYDDYTHQTTINQWKPGVVTVTTAELVDVKNIFTKNGKRLTIATISDKTGQGSVLWFNQHYLSKTLKTGAEYNFSGKLDLFSNKLTLISPSFETHSENNLHTSGLVPIYHETSGISSKWLRTRIYDVLSTENDITEFLPQSTLNKHKLSYLSEAINTIHFPKNRTQQELAHTRLGFDELLLEMLNVEQAKQERKVEVGIKMTADTDKLVQLENSLAFALSNSQKQAIEHILQDMQQETAMNRLLEGDVGSGKTIVAIFASYLVSLNKYKTLYLAPTEVLAKQHFETFKTVLGQFGIKVGLNTSSQKDKGDFDIVVGTHALFFKEHHDVGLVIIDEQHRFGVEQRAKLNDGVHVLTMSATPIPRTLALTLYGDLDISVLAPLAHKKEIKTKVVTEKYRSQIYEWLAQQNAQTFVVCPFIEESENEMLENVKAAKAEYENLQPIFKNKKLGLLHGKLSTKEKEAVIADFRSGEINVLVSTPVIEVGIDIPDAEIIVIESAERYGLASLHQLRGRVGRGEKQGTCIPIMSSNSQTAFTRLKHLETINNGLELAEVDMRTRGHGDVFGTMQHGFKQFRLADITNVELLEKVKAEAQELIGSIDKYQLLKEKLYEKSIANN